jgi:putative hydrolase of the HAD superfamily
VVATAIGADDLMLLEGLRSYFRTSSAWKVHPQARCFIARARAAGLKLAVVSNWDVSLRPLLTELHLDDFDALVISAEVGLEKPDVAMFTVACDRLRVDPSQALMIGDSRADDVEGALAAGCRALHFGRDIADFVAAARHLGLSP